LRGINGMRFSIVGTAQHLHAITEMSNKNEFKQKRSRKIKSMGRLFRINDFLLQSRNPV
jgi:hypothetical protein